MAETMLTQAPRTALLNRFVRLCAMLKGPDGDVVEDEFDKFLARRQCWVDYTAPVTPAPKPVFTPAAVEPARLQHGTSIRIPATSTRFVASEPHVFNRESSIQFKNIDVSFKLIYRGVIEEPMNECALCYDDLLCDAKNEEIVLGLGSTRKETRLTALEYLLSLQPNGEQGILKTTGSENGFFIPGANGVLGLAIARWREGGWVLQARKAGHQIKNDIGLRIFSPDPMYVPTLVPADPHSQDTEQQLASA